MALMPVPAGSPAGTGFGIWRTGGAGPSAFGGYTLTVAPLPPVVDVYPVLIKSISIGP